MNRCTIRFLRKQSSPASEDDILNVVEDTTSDTYYRLTFRPWDLKKAAEFYLDTEATLDYIRTLLRTLTYDTTPFEEIQVDTVIHPSILYHVSDLDNYDIRRDVMNTIGDALRHDVEMVRQ